MSQLLASKVKEARAFDVTYSNVCYSLHAFNLNAKEHINSLERLSRELQALQAVQPDDEIKCLLASLQPHLDYTHKLGLLLGATNDLFDTLDPASSDN